MISFWISVVPPKPEPVEARSADLGQFASQVQLM
jgi:hypothetical protein